MSQLTDNLNSILKEKELKIIPENIKAGVEIFNIKGKYGAAKYTPLEYIKCTGTQYLDLGIKVQSGFGFEIDVIIEEYTGANLFGGAFGTSNKTHVYFGLRNNKCRFYYSDGTESITLSESDYGNRHTYKFIYNKDTDKYDYYYDSNLISSHNLDIYTGSQIALFTYRDSDGTLRNDNSTDPQTAKCTFYNFKIYSQETVVYDFIPVIDSNNIVCLYDKCTDKFYYNEGTEDFIYGDKIENILTITPSNIQQEFTGYYDSIICDGSANLLPENIKEGIEIFGVAGQYSASNNALITSDNISSGTTYSHAVILKELDFTNVDTSMFTSFGSAFMGCENLTKIIGLDTSNATAMNQMFKDCPNLKEICDLNMSKCTVTGAMFSGCTSIEEIGDWLNTARSTYMIQMFFNCTNLVTLPKLSGFSLSSNENGVANMFYGCLKLSDESLNNILEFCISAVAVPGSYRRLNYIGLTEEQATRCTTLSNYQAFLDAGWTTGY